MTEAYNVLKSAAYSSSTAATWPVETIVRGGTGENYINAARGATIAYQNALRWKIDGTEDNAKHAVDVLMAWAHTTKAISGDSNYALAAGIYGYQFAQAAELMRDYDGWSATDFQTFKNWMLNVWYPSSIGFLRGRNGTWENSGKWWQAPGHYWSNWGLCNALCVLSIGVLCDDVFIYNQGLSFMKYDQCGTFTDPRTSDPILNNGLTEFIGNLVVTTTESELETGAYGKLGQMNESGRDIGHATFAAGLSADIAHLCWNQGDDLFSFMDHRLAAGLEYVAAQTDNTQNLPWTNYSYATNGIYYTDSRCWTMTEPALGEQIRNYWGTIIGHYEGIKGVKMPFSEIAYNKMGIDAGGQGSTSGGYDHLGYSVLLNTYDGIAPADKVPTELSPKMTYNGQTIEHNELGGLVNKYSATTNPGLAKGTVVTLQPQLPDSVEDTGLWNWSTGETTKDITVVANESKVYRATYTNKNGIKSEQVFTLAVQGDSDPSRIKQYINDVETASADVSYGSSVTLTADGVGGYGSIRWDNGQTTNSITIPTITTSRDISVIYTNQSGTQSMVTFHLNVQNIVPNIVVGNTTYSNVSTKIVKPGVNVAICPSPSEAQVGGSYTWKIDGQVVSTSDTLFFDTLETSKFPIVEYSMNSELLATLQFNILVKPTADVLVDVGKYMILHRPTNTYLTNNGEDGIVPFFTSLVGKESNPDSTQIWIISRAGTAKYDLISLYDSLYMSSTGTMKAKTYKPHRISVAAGTNLVAFYNASTSKYWTVTEGTINFEGTDDIDDFDFELIPIKDYQSEDVNRDKNVDSQDVLKIYEYMKTATQQPDSSVLEDVNSDSMVDSQDVLKVYEYMNEH